MLFQYFSMNYLLYHFFGDNLYGTTGSSYKIDMLVRHTITNFYHVHGVQSMAGQRLGKQILLSGYIIYSALNYYIHTTV